jgi:hypothetical protein
MDFLLGTWKGETKTWFDPEGDPERGDIETRFQRIVGNLFIEEIYSGAIGEKAHEGRRIYGTDSRLGETTCHWLDSFHTGGTVLEFRGTSDKQSISVSGHYYGGDEKWGWRIEFRSLSTDRMEMKHFNVSPDGKVERAIESTLIRV